MCATCGCGGETAIKDHLHGHDHGHDHGHEHGHDHDHSRRTLVAVEARILGKNDALAQKNRDWFGKRRILALNLVGAPGAGKTALIERTIGEFAREAAIFVVEGDQASALDSERIRRAGAPVVQLNTGAGCHLDAAMVGDALAELRPGRGAVVLIENVGNLVCPALFDLGERAKVVLFSVAEGEDKPLKYPHMFRAANLVVVNKVDLLPHLEFDLERAVANLRAVNPRAAIVPLSTRSGAGMAAWCDWLRRERRALRDAVFA
jgi:hydrogenase nickel incorporation protein HypB